MLCGTITQFIRRKPMYVFVVLEGRMYESKNLGLDRFMVVIIMMIIIIIQEFAEKFGRDYNFDLNYYCFVIR